MGDFLQPDFAWLIVQHPVQYEALSNHVNKTVAYFPLKSNTTLAVLASNQK
jgi:hypothetical protein